ncbi:hypothetical protein AAG570_006903, partial [Ranatra chinensis]
LGGVEEGGGLYGGGGGGGVRSQSTGSSSASPPGAHHMLIVPHPITKPDQHHVVTQNGSGRKYQCKMCPSVSTQYYYPSASSSVHQRHLNIHASIAEITHGRATKICHNMALTLHGPVIINDQSLQLPEN